MSNDNAWLDKMLAERRRERAQRLLVAREQASVRGKEPFDFARLCELYDPSSDMAPADRPLPAGTAERYEEKYYLDYADALSVEEFARRLNQLDEWIP